MKKINLAFIINSIHKGGPSNVVLNIINSLPQDKYNITLVTLFVGNDKTIIHELINKNVTVIEENNKNKIRFMLSGKKKLEKICNDYHFDIVHTHGFIPDFCISNCKADIYKITTVHCNLLEDYHHEYGQILGKIYFLFHIKALKRINKVICCSKSVAESIEKYIKNAQYILNGINVQPLEKKLLLEKTSLGIPQDSIVYIFVGRLEKRKNVLFLIRNFKKYHKNNEYLLIIGDGTLYEQCKKEADTNIILLGFKKEPALYYALADYYISASKSEGLSISIIEAMSYGLGLFLSKIPSHQEIMNLSKNVYLGEVFHKSDFAFNLQKLRNNYNKIQKEEIKKIQEQVLSAKNMSLQYEKYYSELMEKNNEKS